MYIVQHTRLAVYLYLYFSFQSFLFWQYKVILIQLNPVSIYRTSVLCFVNIGYIGKLKIEIPVTHIQSKTWVLHIDQVYLVAEPSKLAEVRKS